MSMHDRRLPHEEERPCFVCGKKTRALKKGVLQVHPRCDECVARLAEEHTKALAQQRKQDQALRNPKKE